MKTPEWSVERELSRLVALQVQNFHTKLFPKALESSTMQFTICKLNCSKTASQRHTRRQFLGKKIFTFSMKKVHSPVPIQCLLFDEHILCIFCAIEAHMRKRVIKKSNIVVKYLLSTGGKRKWSVLWSQRVSPSLFGKNYASWKLQISNIRFNLTNREDIEFTSWIHSASGLFPQHEFGKAAARR